MKFDAVVITASEKGARGERRDESGDVVEGLLLEIGAASVVRVMLPDDVDKLADALRRYSDEEPADLIITTGGTGMAPCDVTPEATLAVIDRLAPGFTEAIRTESLKITPRAMLSRAVSGIRGRTLIINFPGSPKACSEAFGIIEPALAHALELLAGQAGDCAR